MTWSGYLVAWHACTCLPLWSSLLVGWRHRCCLDDIQYTRDPVCFFTLCGGGGWGSVNVRVFPSVRSPWNENPTVCRGRGAPQRPAGARSLLTKRWLRLCSKEPYAHKPRLAFVPGRTAGVISRGEQTILSAAAAATTSAAGNVTVGFI